MHALLFVTAVFINGSYADDQATEMKNLSGKWKVEQAEANGSQVPDEVRQSLTLTMKDDKYEVPSPNGGKDEGTFRLDVSKKPKTMEIKGTKGPNQGKTILAIYELNKDTLKICYDVTGKNYPPEFSAPANSGRLLITFRRSKD